MDISILSWMLPSLFGVSLLFAASLWGFLWQKRAFLGEVATAASLVGGVFLVVAPLDLLAKLLLLAVQFWFVVLGVRLFYGRLDAAFLRTSTKLNAGLGFAVLLVVALLWWLLAPFGTWLAFSVVAYFLGAAAIAFLLVFLYQTIWTLKHYQARDIQILPDDHLPTVTLAIPARNETHALTDCLSAAVASDYPKLEILVLDDCSQDKTSALIRSFAHDGVRFIQGDQPARGWLGKNQALETLAAQANGDYIIFTGVDTQLSPQSISRLVRYALSYDQAMLSVLPQRRDNLTLATLMWQLRYFWQIVMPITRRRLPVASQAWLIKADVLRQLGGFSAVKNKILPESFFARRLFDSKQYRFLIADTQLGITTAKKWSSQNESAIRLLYPIFKRQPLYLFAGCIGVLLFVLQFSLVLILPFFYDFSILWWLALINCVLLLVSYGLVVIRTLPKVWFATLLTLPLALVQEFVLMIMSLLLYEFGEVNWKGRNICYPVINTTFAKHQDS